MTHWRKQQIKSRNKTKVKNIKITIYVVLFFVVSTALVGLQDCSPLHC